MARASNNMHSLEDLQNWCEHHPAGIHLHNQPQTWDVLHIKMMYFWKMNPLIADKVAAIGFYVVVPDFFYGDPYVPETPLSSWFRNHLPAKGAKYARNAVADLKSKGASAVGVAGFCWRGMTVSKLSSFSEIKAAVILHPGPLSDDYIKGKGHK
ncbi:endo-1,3;1,4-beta-D-glucanase-like protein [Tanacetum coccineum]|uniref:Endo-1,31,4-beta-D-glucanase-like protein n=1 Tax=Tanacetum coccineum TaxID=301880 RepID=A0ABQ5ITX6_9ASTR